MARNALALFCGLLCAVISPAVLAAPPQKTSAPASRGSAVKLADPAPTAAQQKCVASHRACAARCKTSRNAKEHLACKAKLTCTTQLRRCMGGRR